MKGKNNNNKSASKRKFNKRNFDRKDDSMDKNDSMRSVYPKSKGDNDLSWHAKSAQLLTDSANIPWSWATGKPILRANNMRGSETAFILPGLHVMRTVLVPGVGDKHSDAVNIAAQALYTDIRRELKSANQYDPSDVMIYILAVGEVMANISWLTRIIGTAMKYSFENIYMPDILLRAQGVDPASVENHVAEFRSRVNQLIAKASQIWIPKGFSFLERARWEYANYYSEGPSAKDQIYFFTPALWRKFEMLEETDYAGALTPIAYIGEGAPDTMLSWEDLCDILDEQIEALVGDSDFHNIAGDLFNRYGAGGVETFTLIPDGAICVTAYSFEVLEQMHNAQCLPQLLDIYYHPVDEATRNHFFSVFQDETNGVIVIPNQISSSNIATTGPAANPEIQFKATRHAHPILTVHDSPNAAKTMLITRLTNAVVDYNDTTNIYTLDAACEWIVAFDIYYTNGNGSMLFDRYCNLMLVNTNWNQTFARLSSFHYHPLITLFTNTTAADLNPYLFGEQDVIALISPEQLRDINRVDLMSMFAVPDVGSVKG